MELNWDLWLRVLGPVLGAAVGFGLSRVFEQKPKLVSFLGHVSAFALKVPGTTEPLHVFTHSIVVRNGGGKPATNLRIGHRFLPPNVQVNPDMKYEISQLPGGEYELLLPRLLPKDQVTISYLYYPPLTWDQVNTGVKSDEEVAKIIQVLPTPTPAKWFRNVVWFLLGLGIVTALYLVISVLAWVAT